MELSNKKEIHGQTLVFRGDDMDFPCFIWTESDHLFSPVSSHLAKLAVALKPTPNHINLPLTLQESTKAVFLTY